MHEFIVALISFFLIEPLQSQMAERFGDVSPAVVSSITGCLSEATPVLIQQATDDPWQAATQVVGIWSGMTPPEEILSKTTPGCAAAVAELRAPSAESES